MYLFVQSMMMTGKIAFLLSWVHRKQTQTKRILMRKRDSLI